MYIKRAGIAPENIFIITLFSRTNQALVS